jgi:hypothetical protein
MIPTDPPRSRNVKLTDAEWAALERIARLNGLEWGGIPSRSEAVRLLIREAAGRPNTNGDDHGQADV